MIFARVKDFKFHKFAKIQIFTKSPNFVQKILNITNFVGSRLLARKGMRRSLRQNHAVLIDWRRWNKFWITVNLIINFKKYYVHLIVIRKKAFNCFLNQIDRSRPKQAVLRFLFRIFNVVDLDYQFWIL